MIFNMTPDLSKGLGTYPFHIAITDQRENNIHFKTFLTDSLVQTDKVMELDYYQPNCNPFLSVRIAPEYLLLLIGHEIWIEKNHSERVHKKRPTFSSVLGEDQRYCMTSPPEKLKRERSLINLLMLVPSLKCRLAKEKPRFLT
jgi:hypothetical protein